VKSPLHIQLITAEKELQIMYCFHVLFFIFGYFFASGLQAPTKHADGTSVLKRGSFYVTNSIARQNQDASKKISKLGQGIRFRGPKVHSNVPAERPLLTVYEVHPLVRPILIQMLEQVTKKFD